MPRTVRAVRLSVALLLVFFVGVASLAYADSVTGTTSVNDAHVRANTNRVSLSLDTGDACETLHVASSLHALPAARAAQQTQRPYHGNVQTKVFHRPSCRYYDCKNCTAVFKTREAAVAAGYRPGGHCKP